MSQKKILIIDEDGFSKICAAILNNEGYETRCAIPGEDVIAGISRDDLSLIVSSYPYALPYLTSGVIKDIPVIILSDEINGDLIEVMRNLKNSVCMVKPLDFERFKYVVRGIVNGYLNLSGGNIIA
jgi:DNA-binding NtrC family response regulator